MRLFKALGAGLCALFVLAAPALAQTNDPFRWLDGSTVTITTGNASANVALAKLPSGRAQLRIYSACTTAMFIKKGADSTVTAAATDVPIAPGELEVLSIDNNPASPILYIAAISPSGSCTLYITTGAGI